MTHTILRRMVLLSVVAATTACQDGTPATAPAAAENDLTLTAAALDNQAASAEGRGDSERATAFREAAAALRLGVRPSIIAIGVNGELYRFSAVVTANVEVLVGQDTALRRTLVAWRGDRSPVEILRLTTLGDEGSFSSADEPASNPRAQAQGLLVNLERESRWLATAGTAGIADGDIGGECQPLTRADARFRCVRAVFGFQVDGLFRLGGGSPDDGAPAVRVIAETQRVAGVILSPSQNR